MGLAAGPSWGSAWRDARGDRPSSAPGGAGVPTEREGPPPEPPLRGRDPHTRFQLASGGGPPLSRVRLWINFVNTCLRTRALIACRRVVLKYAIRTRTWARP